ncbi:IS4 family transposase [Pontibacter mucosus]|uniref:IS4 family transposase n=1 Tax=Pontibacter mucosus TaxID=1649266 RepID=A0A2T5YLH3_9BACT|nr:IS4 family transposase [Pontibacter mucosus]
MCCGRGFPLQVLLTGGQAGEAPQLPRLLELEEKKPKVLVADKGYDSQVVRKVLREQSIRAQIPERGLPEGNKRRRKGRPPKVSRQMYRQRNIIERLFGRLKEMRRFACRFEKLADSYLAFVQLAFMKICLKPYFSDTP